MPYTLASEHFEFYLRNGFIELQNLLPKENIEFLASFFKEHLKTKFGKSIYSEANAFREGHDLIRKNTAIQKKLFTRNFVDVIAHLFSIDKPRFGFDQFLISEGSDGEKPNISDLGFQESSCISKLKGIILLALSEIDLKENPLGCFPCNPGCATFFKPHFRLSFAPFFNGGKGLYLLIGIGDEKLLYKHVEADPFVHLLKREGYVFGDLLKNSSHTFLKGS